jgi:hypothetical protein
VQLIFKTVIVDVDARECKSFTLLHTYASEKFSQSAKAGWVEFLIRAALLQCKDGPFAERGYCVNWYTVP